MSVSLCVIAKNEATNLEACIAPLREVVSETIVIDTGSTDDTRAIAKRCGARVFEFQWCNNFAAARNQWAVHATGDWIFYLDADDRILPPEREKLRRLFANPDEKLAYMMTVACLTVDGGLGGGVEQARLYRNRPEHLWKYRVHEQITPSLLSTGTMMKDTDIRIVHVGYVDDELVAAKGRRNFDLVELDCAEHPLDPFPMFNRASMLLEIGRHEEAIVSLNICQPFIPKSSPAAPNVRALLGCAYRDAGRLHDALDELRAARLVFPLNRQLPLLEAHVLVALEDLNAAAQALIDIATDGTCATLQDVRARTLFGELQLRLGLAPSARELAEWLTRIRPAYGPAWLLLADATLALGGDLSHVESRLSAIAGTEIVRVLLRAAKTHDTSELEGSAHPFADTVRARLSRAQRMPLLSCLSAPWNEGKPQRVPHFASRVFWTESAA